MGKSKLLVGYFIGGIILIIFNLILYSFVAQTYDQEIGDPTFDLYAGLITTIWAGITMITCFRVMSVFTFKAPPGKVWCLIAMGCLCWCIGEGIFSFFLVTGEEPFPSIADFFYILGYPLVISGLLLQQKSTKASLQKSEIVIILSFIIAIIVIVIIGAFMPVLDQYNAGDYDLLSTIIILLYPVMDWFLLPSVLILFFRFKGGEFSRSWIIEFMGYILMIGADIVYAIVDVQGVPLAQFYYDHLYNLSYFLLTLGALHLYTSLKGN